MNSRVRTAIIPVAGLGTRVLPASKAIPKEMMTVCDKPVIQHVVEEAVEAGITQIVLVTRSGKEAIENHFDSHYELEAELTKKGKTSILDSVANMVPQGVEVVSIRQPNALGLGHAIACASGMIRDEAFAVMLPDVLLLKAARQARHDMSSMVKRWEETEMAQILVEKVPMDRIDAYGVVDCNGVSIEPGNSAEIIAMVEKPPQEEAPSDMAVVGRYILPKRVMKLLKTTAPGAGNEIQLTDALETLLDTSKMEAHLMKSQSYDCGNKLGYAKANVAASLRHGEISQDFKQFLKSLEL